MCTRIGQEIQGTEKGSQVEKCPKERQGNQTQEERCLGLYPEGKNQMQEAAETPPIVSPSKKGNRPLQLFHQYTFRQEGLYDIGRID